MEKATENHSIKDPIGYPLFKNVDLGQCLVKCSELIVPRSDGREKLQVHLCVEKKKKTKKWNESSSFRRGHLET